MARIYELNDMESSSNGMRLTASPTSTSVASRLYANGGQRSSRRTSFSSEPDIISSDTETVHSDFNDLQSQVGIITKKLMEVTDQQQMISEEKSRLKTENAVLQERIAMLEEQVQSTEERWKEKLDDEKQRTKDSISRFEREKELAVMQATLNLQALQSNYDAQIRKVESLTEENKKIQSKHRELKDELAEALNNCMHLEKERDEIKEEYEKYRLEAENRMENSSELLEELARQTDELRRQELEPRPSIADKLIDLEDEIGHLREENKRLKKQNEELQSQILHDSVERGQLLLQGGMSLADELNSLDSNELVNALKEQELDNQKLRQYINGILMRVIERHPEILEIKDEELQHRDDLKSNS